MAIFIDGVKFEVINGDLHIKTGTVKVTQTPNVRRSGTGAINSQNHVSVTSAVRSMAVGHTTTIHANKQSSIRTAAYNVGMKVSVYKTKTPGVFNVTRVI